MEEDRDVNGEREPDSEDDCIVAGDDDCDAVEDEEADDGLGIEEEANLENDHFPREAARDEEDGSEVDSGDTIWNDERILDPLSSSEDKEAE